MQESPYSALLSLITFDQETNILRSQLRAAHKDLDDLAREKQKLEQARELAYVQWHEARKEVDACELEMKSLEATRATKNALLDSAGSTREYQALRKEIDILVQKQHDLEQQLVSLWNTADNRRRAAETRANALQNEAASLDDRVAQKKGISADLQGQIAAREEQWMAHAQGLPDELLQKYSMMRMAVSDPAVPVEQDACSVCFQHLTRNDLMILQREHFMQCKGCFRFLYRPQQSQSV